MAADDRTMTRGWLSMAIALVVMFSFQVVRADVATNCSLLLHHDVDVDTTTDAFAFMISTDQNKDDRVPPSDDSDDQNSDLDSLEEDREDSWEAEVDRHPTSFIFTTEGSKRGAFAFNEVDGKRVGCPQLDPTSSLQRGDDETITHQMVLYAIKTLVVAADDMNEDPSQFFLDELIHSKFYIPRVNPVTGDVFGAYVVSKFTYKGVLLAAREGMTFLRKNIGAYQLTSVCHWERLLTFV